MTHRRRSSIAVCVFAGLLAAVAGCNSKHVASLQFTSQQKRDVAYSQRFENAYISLNPSGDFDVILADDGLPNQAGDDKAPLKPAPAAPLNQIIHIRVLWRPEPGTKPDHASATNAVIDWYVTYTTSATRRDRLHYQGAGFVTFGVKGSHAKIHISNATITPKQIEGDMTDPLGPASVEGTFIAEVNNRMVQTMVARINADFATTGTPTTSPPPRTPTP